jgi:hypothetical protein
MVLKRENEEKRGGRRTDGERGERGEGRKGVASGGRDDVGVGHSPKQEDEAKTHTEHHVSDFLTSAAQLPSVVSSARENTRGTRWRVVLTSSDVVAATRGEEGKARMSAG